VSGSSLTKSRYLAGLQCSKRLWFEVHEPEESAEADPALEALFERGRRVGEEARERVPGGVLIEGPPRSREERLEATQAALEAGAKVLYEASFEVGGVFVAVDLLERRREGWRLTEVKAALDVKEEHLDDVAVQLFVARRAGLDVRRVEVMHLDRRCRFPRLERLFVREDVSEEAERRARRVGRELGRQRRTLAGARPEVEVGPHCREPRECPFLERCHPPAQQDDLTVLYRLSSKKLAALRRRGYESVTELPDEFELSALQRRQVESLRRRRLVVDPGLGAALAALEEPIAYLDFETVAPAIPAWRGCAPYEAVPVQWSCHVRDGRAQRHYEHLAEPGADPREPLVLALLAATRDARIVLAYHASFEKACLTALARALPQHARELRVLSRRLVDLLPIVRDHVYHPAFAGSFSIKDVLPALVRDSGYADLEVRDGATASALLERLLLSPAEFTSVATRKLRRDLASYCERDTLAMVTLLERLRDLASGLDSHRAR
jgi:uncharacterized protein DUF2779